MTERKYRFTPEAEKMARQLIGAQSAFDSKEEAVKDALKKMKKEMIYQIWHGEGKYVVSKPEAWEFLLRKGYKRIYDTLDLIKIDEKETDNIEED